jgi:lysophospholipid acyltransferase (LPLAT)-like uncharacterized protein
MRSEIGKAQIERGMRTPKQRWHKRLLQSEAFLGVASLLLHGLMTFIHATTRFVPESDDFMEKSEGYRPGIFAMWHGQQFLIPYHRPREAPVTALTSRSADAEINARVLERNGVEAIRGSGGRPSFFQKRKGGAQALRALIKAIERGRNITFIADVSKSTPKQAGEGIIMLAKLSGRPIFPIALATSSRYVLKNTWDKTTINLPFGKGCLKIGDPIFVPREASREDVQQFRDRLTEEMNRVTRLANEAVGVRQ